MKTLTMLSLAVVVAIACGGCEGRMTAAEGPPKVHAEVVHTIIPPEARIVEPGVFQIWIEGHWGKQDEDQWSWIPCHWEVVPGPGYVWMSDRWWRIDELKNSGRDRKNERDIYSTTNVSSKGVHNEN